MLRISKHVEGTSLHFTLSPPRSDGYFMSHWLGHGAKELGFEGPVGRGDVRALLEGQLTRGRNEIQRGDGPVPGGGLNLCFTPPPSLSVLWSQLEKDHRHTIQAINHEAVRNAITYLQDEAGLMPSQLDPHPREEVGFVGALFAHGIGQKQIPELQTHVVLSNACIRSDGSFGTLDPSRLLKLKAATEAIFHLSLAHGLQSQLGLRLVRNADSFEIAGVPSIESWEPSPSQNATPLNNAVADASIGSGHGSPEVPTNIFSHWREIGRQRGWGPDKASKLLGLDPRLETYVSPHEVFAAVETLRAPFELHELVRTLATNFQTSTVSSAGLQRAIKSEVHGFEAFRANSGETLYKTGIRQAPDPVPPRDLNHQGGNEAHRLPSQSVEALLKASALTEHQKAAFRFVTTTTGTTKALCNFGESERRALMSLAEKQWTAAGLRVVGVCGNAERAAQFQDSTHIATVTAGQALGRTAPKSLIQRANTSIRKGVACATAPARSILRLVRLPSPALNFGGSPIDQRCVVVAEEAHAFGRTHLKMLQDRCAHAGAKLVVLGNAEKLPGINPREMFRSKYAPISQSLDGKGQKVPGNEPRNHHGDKIPSRSLSELASSANVHVSEVSKSAPSMLIRGWGKWRDPKSNLILTQTVAEADALNVLAQADCRQRGLLGNREISHGRQTFHSGDRVVFEKSSKELGVTSGGFGTIAALCKGWISVRLDDTDRRVEIPLRQYREVKLGYAVPRDRAQGSLAENAHVLISSPQQAKEMVYLKDSRAFFRTEFYLHRGKANDEAIAHRRWHEPEIKKVESMPVESARTQKQPGAEGEQRPVQNVNGVSGAPLANGNARKPEPRSPNPSKGQSTNNGQSSSKSQSQSQGR